MVHLAVLLPTFTVMVPPPAFFADALPWDTDATPELAPDQVTVFLTVVLLGLYFTASVFVLPTVSVALAGLTEMDCSGRYAARSVPRGMS